MWSLASDQMTVAMVKTQIDFSATLNFRLELVGVHFWLDFCTTSYFLSIYSQVILKPDPGNSQDLFIRSLSALGRFSSITFSDWFSTLMPMFLLIICACPCHVITYRFFTFLHEFSKSVSWCTHTCISPFLQKCQLTWRRKTFCEEKVNICLNIKLATLNVLI